MAEENRTSTRSASLAVALSERKERIDRADDKVIVDLVKDIVSASQRAKETYLVPKWLRALYFFLGFQHIDWNAKKRRFYPMQLQPDRRITVNIVRSRALSSAAAVVRHDPTLGVGPYANDPLAREEARTGLKVLQAVLEEANWELMVSTGAIQRVLFGGVFKRARFDPTIGPREESAPLAPTDVLGGPVPGLPEVLVNGRGQPQMIYPEPQGQILVDVLSHFDMHVPPSARLPIVGRLPWIAERRAIPVDEIATAWDVRLKPDERANDITSLLNLDLGRFFSTGYGTSLDSIFLDERESDAAWVTELHHQRCDIPGFEEGRHIVIAGDKLVLNEPGELRNGRLPYEYFPLQVVPLSFWGSTFVDDMIEPQVSYNRARGHIDMARSMYAFPYITFKENSISRDEITGGGRVLQVKPVDSDPIKIHEPPGITQAAVAELQYSRTDVESASSIHNSSMGQMMGASPQPVGTINALQQADMGDLEFGMKVSRTAAAGIGQNCLELVQEHYTTKRTGRFTGETEDPEIFDYSSTDVANGLKVYVKEESAQTQNKEAMRTSMAEIVKSGVLGPVAQDPAFIAHFLETFDMPSPNSFLSLSNLDVADEEHEIGRMVKGQPMEIGPDDNHEIRLQVIARFTKTSAFDTMDPAAKQILLQHREQHKMLLEQQMMQAMQQQMAMQPPVQEPPPAQ